MKTLNEVIAELKAENPSLRSGNEEDGYTDLTSAEYEATILEWANNIMAKLEAETLTNEKEAEKEALFTKLGITPEEAKLILS